MEKYGIREGYWDSAHTVAFMRKVVELEEAVVETEYVPESARVRVIEEIYHSEGKWSAIKYIRGTKRTGEAVKEDWYRW